jgi:hypothetical protein
MLGAWCLIYGVPLIYQGLRKNGPVGKQIILQLRYEQNFSVYSQTSFPKSLRAQLVSPITRRHSRCFVSLVLGMLFVTSRARAFSILKAVLATAPFEFLLSCLFINDLVVVDQTHFSCFVKYVNFVCSLALGYSQAAESSAKSALTLSRNED